MWGDAPIANAYTYISPYFDGSYFTGQMPPISIPYTPFCAVIDLETMEVMDKDLTQTDYLYPQDMLSLAIQANSD